MIVTKHWENVKLKIYINLHWHCNIRIIMRETVNYEKNFQMEAILTDNHWIVS